MSTALRLAAVIVFTATLAACGPTHAGSTCRDGTHSTATGRGSCAHHGGVA